VSYKQASKYELQHIAASSDLPNEPTTTRRNEETTKKVERQLSSVPKRAARDAKAFIHDE
jgi:antitoxin component of RelBE/YafQ-DinJ toxin-antitoxin module